MVASPVLQDVFDRLRDQYMSSWVQSNPEETQARDRVYMAIRVLDEVRAQLRAVASGGRNERINNLKNGRK